MSEVSRKTKETDIKVKVNLYGDGKYNINTKIGFFDHMLEALSKHSMIDMDIVCDGDIHIDYHHSVEDVAITLAKAIRKDLFPIASINRFANRDIVMDEACVSCGIDVSNRPFLVFDLPISGKIGDFDVELVEEFFRALAFNLGITLHIVLKRGVNKHHIVECAFKSFAITLRDAITKNEKNAIPSTKGVI